jgi:DNA-binding transcriptional regulator YiaG
MTVEQLVNEMLALPFEQQQRVIESVRLKRAMADKPPYWPARLIGKLRGGRSAEEFARLIGEDAETVRRWEAGGEQPGREQLQRLNALAEREDFWRALGRQEADGDDEQSLDRTARQINEGA